MFVPVTNLDDGLTYHINKSFVTRTCYDESRDCYVVFMVDLEGGYTISPKDHRKIVG